MSITVFNQRTHPDLFTLVPLQGRVTAVIGYGNQGRAQALCIRDSGLACIVGARIDSRAFRQASQDGMDVRSIEKASASADLVIVALPDEVHADVVGRTIIPHVRDGATVGFLHGYSIRFGGVAIPDKIGCILLAPKGPGSTLRALFLEGRGLPALFAIHRDSSRKNAEALAFAWATAIGAGRSGVIATTFSSETETDLFGEQAVLCGGMLSLMIAAFETLVQAGYEPELAYIECCHELKQVADLLYARGPTGMAAAISNTAEFGAYRAGPAIVDDSTRARMAVLLQSIRTGEFAEALQKDSKHGFAWFVEQRDRLKDHSINAAGSAVRALMPWLSERSE